MGKTYEKSDDGRLKEITSLETTETLYSREQILATISEEETKLNILKASVDFAKSVIDGWKDKIKKMDDLGM